MPPKPRTETPFYDWERFFCMFQSTMNGQRVLYCAETDAIESDDRNADLNECEFIELKTANPNHGENRPDDLRRWWSQCRLANIKKIIVGHKNRNNIVTKLSHIDVGQIPQRVNDKVICFERQQFLLFSNFFHFIFNLINLHLYLLKFI